jgi:hypothetical protein
MRRCHERRNHKGSLIGTNRVEPGRVYGPCDADEFKTNTARCEILVQDADLPVDLRIWDVATLHSIVLGDDVDCVNPKDQL